MELVNSIVKSIKQLENNEVDKFIEQRISELANTEKKEIGLNTDTYIYNGFLDEKIRVNYVCIETEDEDASDNTILMFGSMKFDDPDMFKFLIYEIRRRRLLFESIYDSILEATDNYLSLTDEDRIDNKEYYKRIKDAIECSSALDDKTYSIQVYRALNISTCTQIAGTNHNMFKFLGIDSDYVIGMEDGDLHAFNIVYPWGREEDAILLDAMRPVTSDPFLYLLDKEKKEKLFSNEEVKLAKDDIEKAYKKLLDLNIEGPYDEESIYSLLESKYTEEPGEDLLPTSTKHCLIFRRVDFED